VQAAVGLGGRTVPLEQRRRRRWDGFLAGVVIAAAAAQRERSARQEWAEAKAGLGGERPRWCRREQQPMAVGGHRADGPLPVLLLKTSNTAQCCVCACTRAFGRPKYFVFLVQRRPTLRLFSATDGFSSFLGWTRKKAPEEGTSGGGASNSSDLGAFFLLCGVFCRDSRLRASQQGGLPLASKYPCTRSGCLLECRSLCCWAMFFVCSLFFLRPDRCAFNNELHAPAHALARSLLGCL